MSVSETLRHVSSVRSRLRNPPNAVKDMGIDLKREKFQLVPIVQAEPVVDNVVVVDESTGDRASRLNRRIELLNELLDRLENRRAIMFRSTQPSIEAIMRATCEYFEISFLEMQSERRHRSIVRPRQVAAYIATKITTQSLPSIGRKMGGRDHTTIIAARRKIEKLRQSDPEIDRAVRAITAKFA